MPVGRVRPYGGAGAWKNVKVQFAVCATIGVVANSRQGNRAKRVLRNIGVSFRDATQNRRRQLRCRMPGLPDPFAFCAKGWGRELAANLPRIVESLYQLIFFRNPSSDLL